MAAIPYNSSPAFAGEGDHAQHGGGASGASRSYLCLLLLALTACDAADPQPSANSFEPAAFSAKPACESRNFEGTPFTACRFDAARDELRLVLAGRDGAPLRSLAALEAALGRDADRVRYAMNAGMYDEAGRPIGLYVEAGEERKSLNTRDGEGNFHLMPNGVFAVDGKGRPLVTPSRQFAKDIRSPRWATQSGPMLVIDGKLHPKFDANGESQLIRNGVGVCGPGVAWFALSEEGVSFGRFARFFRDGLGCPNALYLDGTVSSLWDPGAGRQDAYAELGPMLVVLRR
ncbi:MAG TPA: phosphodiester glycosidase family protein [Allosphingosinicella sp.]|jgi:uncharacterized protein YigE (DUF2233 family)